MFGPKWTVFKESYNEIKIQQPLFITKKQQPLFITKKKQLHKQDISERKLL